MAAEAGGSSGAVTLAGAVFIEDVEAVLKSRSVEEALGEQRAIYRQYEQLEMNLDMRLKRSVIAVSLAGLA